jgi:hypothetical protein
MTGFECGANRSQGTLKLDRLARGLANVVEIESTYVRTPQLS